MREPLSTPYTPSAGGITESTSTVGTPQTGLYQPLAKGDTWKYQCRDVVGGGENGGLPFAIQNTVVGTTVLNGQTFDEFLLEVPQVPSKPLKITKVIQLLHNDPFGNVRIQGYLVNGKVSRIPLALFVTAHPPGEMHKAFDYEGPEGLTIDRIFFGLEKSNPTKLGTFEVAPYFESHSTHDYGYALGKGIVEEDHGPNYQVDCLITAITLH